MRLLLLLMLAGCAHVTPPVDASLAGRRDCVKEMGGVHSIYDFLTMGSRRREAGDQSTDPEEKKRQYRCSLAAFQSASSLDPEDPAPHLASAELYFELRGLRDAAKEYHRALELAPNSAGANLRLAQIARNDGDVPEALAYLAEEKRVNPKGSEAWVEQGNVEMSTRNFLGAEAQFTRAHQLAPRNRDCLFGRAVARHLLGSLAEAESDFLAVERLDPGFADTYWQLGLLHEKMGKNALPDYEKFKSLAEPGSAMAIRVDEKIHKLSGER